MELVMTISNEELIYNKFIAIYPHFLKSITEISENTSDGQKFIESQFKVFDFDDVENCHEVGGLHSSPDSLIYFNKGLYFIEYKEGSCKTANIRAKIHEAVATLYSFCRKYLPQIGREEFFELNIRYAVVLRRGDPTSFLNALEASTEKFKLQNLEGYILKKTKVVAHPNDVKALLCSLTKNEVLPMVVHNREFASTPFA